MDEAFCYLCMMNYWDEWEWRNEKGEDSITKSNRKTYWTSGSYKVGNEVEDEISTYSSHLDISTVTTNSDVSDVTSGSAGKNGDFVCGWNCEGRMRFNKIVKNVLKLRSREEQKEMERALKDEFMKQEKSKNSKKCKRCDARDSGGTASPVIDMYAIENGDCNLYTAV